MTYYVRMIVLEIFERTRKLLQATQFRFQVRSCFSFHCQLRAENKIYIAEITYLTAKKEHVAYFKFTSQNLSFLIPKRQRLKEWKRRFKKMNERNKGKVPLETPALCVILYLSQKRKTFSSCEVSRQYPLVLLFGGRLEGR